MKQILTGCLISFIIVTGLLAGIGLLIMDHSIDSVLAPEVLDAPADIPESLNAEHQMISVRDEGQLDAIYINVPDSHFVILFCHEMKGHLYQRLPLLEKFRDMGFSVLAIDFRGYGASSPVEISDETLKMDLKFAYDALHRRKWTASQIILYGQGLSAGVQGLLLNEKTCGGWILDNPIPSLRDALSNRVSRTLTEGRLSMYEPFREFTGPAMVCYDPLVLNGSIRAELLNTRQATLFCEVTGRRIPDAWDSVDWGSWMHCMTQFKDRMAMLPIPAATQRNPAKKTTRDAVPETESPKNEPQ